MVTGAAQGIGLAIATTLASHGAFVFLADLDADRTTAAAARIRGEGTVGLACNVTDENDVQSVVDRALEDTGRLDIWVNNAGITRDASLEDALPGRLSTCPGCASDRVLARHPRRLQRHARAQNRLDRQPVLALW